MSGAFAHGIFLKSNCEMKNSTVSQIRNTPPIMLTPPKPLFCRADEKRGGRHEQALSGLKCGREIAASIERANGRIFTNL